MIFTIVTTPSKFFFNMNKMLVYSIVTFEMFLLQAVIASVRDELFNIFVTEQ